MNENYIIFILWFFGFVGLLLGSDLVWFVGICGGTLLALSCFIMEIIESRRTKK